MPISSSSQSVTLTGNLQSIVSSSFRSIDTSRVSGFAQDESTGEKSRLYFLTSGQLRSKLLTPGKYTFSIKLSDLGHLERTGVVVQENITLESIFGGEKSSSILGAEPWFVSRHRYFSPITYWWADFWSPISNWEKTLDNIDVLGPVIINIDNGPGKAQDQDWIRQIEIARARGAKVLGYVSTDYGKREEVKILDDTQKHVEFYRVDGVFVDELTNGVDVNVKYVPQYLALYQKIKEKYGQDFWVVGNPGTSTSEEVLQCADTVMVYESDADYYLNPTWNIHPSYYSKYPSTKFWHVIHSVRNEEQAKAVLKDVGTKYHPSFVYLTDLQFNNGANNPYASPPSQWLIDLQAKWCRRAL